MEKLKELWAGLLLMATLAWILLHLVWVRIHGAVIITERNSGLLNLEITLVCLVIILALERLIGDIRK